MSSKTNKTGRVNKCLRPLGNRILYAPGVSRVAAEFGPGRAGQRRACSQRRKTAPLCSAAVGHIDRTARPNCRGAIAIAIKVVHPLLDPLRAGIAQHPVTRDPADRTTRQNNRRRLKRVFLVADSPPLLLTVGTDGPEMR